MAVHLETRPAPLGEVRVETGTGFVMKVEAGERNTQVHIRSDLAAVRDLVTGWADPSEVPLAGPGLQNAHVRYHIETQRRPGKAPVDTPIAELGNRQKLRKVVSLELVDAADPQAASTTEPPASSGASAASSGSPATTGASQTNGRGPDTHSREQRVGADNPGFPATLVNMAAALSSMAARLPSAGPFAERLTDAGDTLRSISRELMDIAS